MRADISFRLRIPASTDFDNGELMREPIHVGWRTKRSDVETGAAIVETEIMEGKITPERRVVRLVDGKFISIF